MGWLSSMNRDPTRSENTVSGHYNSIEQHRLSGWCVNSQRSKPFWSLGIHAWTDQARLSDRVVVPGNDVFQPRWVPVHAAQPPHGLSRWFQSPHDQRWKSIKIGNGVGGSPHLSRECWVRKPRKKVLQKILLFLIYSALKSMESYDWARRTRVLHRHGLLGEGSPISENPLKKNHPPSFCNSHVLTRKTPILTLRFTIFGTYALTAHCAEVFFVYC